MNARLSTSFYGYWSYTRDSCAYELLPMVSFSERCALTLQHKAVRQHLA